MSNPHQGAAILDDLSARGLIQDTTDDAALRARLEAGPITLYCGFDPTADSLHVGNLVPLLLLDERMKCIPKAFKAENMRLGNTSR